MRTMKVKKWVADLIHRCFPQLFPLKPRTISRDRPLRFLPQMDLLERRVAPLALTGASTTGTLALIPSPDPSPGQNLSTSGSGSPYANLNPSPPGTTSVPSSPRSTQSGNQPAPGTIPQGAASVKSSPGQGTASQSGLTDPLLPFPDDPLQDPFAEPALPQRPVFQWPAGPSGTNPSADPGSSGGTPLNTGSADNSQGQIRAWTSNDPFTLPLSPGSDPPGPPSVPGHK